MGVSTSKPDKEIDVSKYGFSSSVNKTEIRKELERCFSVRGFTTTALISESPLKWNLKHPNHTYKTVVTADTERDMVFFHQILSVTWDFKHRKILENLFSTMCRVNQSILNGNFEVDTRDGEIRFKICYSTLGLGMENIFTLAEIAFTRSTQR